MRDQYGTDKWCEVISDAMRRNYAGSGYHLANEIRSIVTAIQETAMEEKPRTRCNGCYRTIPDGLHQCELMGPHPGKCGPVTPYAWAIK